MLRDFSNSASALDKSSFGTPASVAVASHFLSLCSKTAMRASRSGDCMMVTFWAFSMKKLWTFCPARTNSKAPAAVEEATLVATPVAVLTLVVFQSLPNSIAILGSNTALRGYIPARHPSRASWRA